MAWDKATPRTRALDIGHLPWPSILGAVFSAVAAKYLVPSEYTATFSRTMLELILERSRTLTEQDFVDQLADFGTRPPAQRVLYMQGLTTAALTTLNRPGAWLLDYAYTVVSVIYGDVKPSVLFSPVPNSCHLELLERCFPDAAQSEHGCSRNNRGNQMEALGWLTYEADRSELVLAHAYHSRLRTRKAVLAEAGATGALEDAGQASAQMEALIQYGAHLGFVYPSSQDTHATSATQGAEPGTRQTAPASQSPTPHQQSYAHQQGVGHLPPHWSPQPDTPSMAPYSYPQQPPPGASPFGAPRMYPSPSLACHPGGRR